MLRRAALVSLIVLLASCSAEPAMVSAPPEEVTGLSLNAVSLLAGESTTPQIQVTIDGQSRPATPTEIRVTSSDTAVIVIGADNALVAVGDGQSDITIAWAANPSISVTRTVTIASEFLTGVTMATPLTMIPGDSASLVVTGAIHGGRSVANPVSVSLASRNPAVVAINGTLLLALSPGQAWLVATAATGVADSALISVAVGTPVQLRVTPRDSSLVAGQQLQLVVTGIADRRGNPVTGITTEFTTTAPAIATVQSDGTVNTVAAGSAMIIATAGTAADTLRLTVTAPPPVFQTLTLTPDSITLHPGESSHVQVRAFDNHGAEMTVPPLTWTSLTPGISVSASGSILASSSISQTIPNGTIRVSSGSVTAQLRVAVVVVVVVPVLHHFVVTPDSITLAPGEAAQPSVQAIDTHGGVMTLPPLSWQSFTAGISVSQAGVISASSSVAATIPNGVVQLSANGITAQVRVAVVVPVIPPPPTDVGYVQLRWIGAAPSPGIAAAFEAARSRINGIFKSFAGVQPVRLDLPANACATGAAAMGETVPGLVIFAEVTTIDGPGNILGSAGPCLVRDDTWLPVIGSMRFDVADMNSMVSNGSLTGVVQHEMMHILGLGTIWGPGPQGQVASPSGADPRFVGANGKAAYTALGAADAASGVPVENTGGSGTRGAHWRESVFHSELMTGWADGSMPMSRVTIGALKDFGYDVDLTKADPFTLGSSLIGSALRASQQIVETSTAPIGIVGPGGKITPFTGTIAH